MEKKLIISVFIILITFGFVFSNNIDPSFYNKPISSTNIYYKGSKKTVIFERINLNKLKNNSHSDSLVLNVRSFGAIGDGIHDDYSAIMRAMKSVSDHIYTVLIPAGSYLISRPLETYNDSTELLFEKGAKIIIKNNTTGSLIIRNNNCKVLNGYFQGNGISAKHIEDGFGILLFGVSDCTIKNCYFDKISGCNIYLSYNKAQGCHYCSIIHNVIINPAGDPKIIRDVSGILIGYSGNGYFHTHNTVADNLIDGNESLADGIAIIAHGNDNTIINNSIRNCTRYGIIAYESSYVDSTLSRTYILHNTVENIGNKYGKPDPYGMGIYIMRSHYSVVSNNNVYNCLINTDNSETLPCGAIADNGSCFCAIDSNTIINSMKYGIDCAYAFNTSIIANKIDSTRLSGIFLINTNNNIIQGNTIKNVGEFGIKGYFDNLSKPSYVNMGFKTFKDFSTGSHIKIKNNIISSLPKRAISLSGTKSNETNKNQDNLIQNISIQKNTFIGSKESDAIQLDNYVPRKIKIKKNHFK